jgi:C4-dicarboxylate-specific signal transduction histidine kinase
MMGLPFCFYLTALVYEWTKERAYDARRQAEVLRADAQAEARILRADRMVGMGQLVAAVAHEVNNPLQYALLNLDAAQTALEPNEARPADVEGCLAALTDVRDGLRRIRDVVADLQRYTGGGRDREVDVDLAESIAMAARMARPRLRGIGALEVEVAHTVPRLRAREGRLDQVSLNLLINAIHALDPQRRSTNRVRIAADVDATGEIVLSVSDNGAGMSEAVRARACEPLFTTKDPSVGTGLGLYVCATIAKDMGGSLQIDSALGRGTTVKMIIPKERAARLLSAAVAAS